jgi:hypothetical protein
MSIRSNSSLQKVLQPAARGIPFQPVVEGDELLMKFSLLLRQALEINASEQSPILGVPPKGKPAISSAEAAA